MRTNGLRSGPCSRILMPLLEQPSAISGNGFQAVELDSVAFQQDLLGRRLREN